nr:hypothetical protein CFP56_12010 [Quercus suber]
MHRPCVVGYQAEVLRYRLRAFVDPYYLLNLTTLLLIVVPVELDGIRLTHTRAIGLEFLLQLVTLPAYDNAEYNVAVRTSTLPSRVTWTLWEVLGSSSSGSLTMWITALSSSSMALAVIQWADPCSARAES